MKQLLAAQEPELTDAPTTAQLDWLSQGLDGFFVQAGHRREDRPLAVFITDETGEPRAGLSGRTGWDQLFISILFVAAGFRGTGLGTKLMNAAEEEGRRRRCKSAWLMTSTHEAKAFYEKRGYQTFGNVERHAPSADRFFLKKTL